MRHRSATNDSGDPLGSVATALANAARSPSLVVTSTLAPKVASSSPSLGYRGSAKPQHPTGPNVKPTGEAPVFVCQRPAVKDLQAEGRQDEAARRKRATTVSGYPDIDEPDGRVGRRVASNHSKLSTSSAPKPTPR